VCQTHNSNHRDAPDILIQKNDISMERDVTQGVTVSASVLKRQPYNCDTIFFNIFISMVRSVS
jgi:hypothetical protein